MPNLNISPYFDDFDENKSFQRILFKPGVAVQARELTQLQTILQKQIEYFGRHIFETGTIIYGGEFDVEDSIEYVRIQTADIAILQSIIGREFTGVSTGLKAYVTHAELDEDAFGTAILFVRYTNSVIIDIDTDNIIRTFASETAITDGVNTYQLTQSNKTGRGSLFGISEGVAFVRGFFVKFEKQKIALEKFATNPSRRVYFKHNFFTVDSNEDITLLDNAQGFFNFSAPGADRLKAQLELVSVPLDTFLSTDDHSILFEIENGNIRERRDRTEYNKIGDELAKRTFDESGDYIVRGFTVYTRDNLDTGSNNGRFTLEAGGNSNLLSVGVESGLGYVKGYEINTLLTRYIDVPKSSESVDINNQVSLVRSGNYTEIKEITGFPNPDGAELVDLYDTEETRNTNGTALDTTPVGNKIGEARVNSILYESGILGGPDAILRLYLFDIKMNPNSSFSQVRAIGNSNFFADTVIENGNAVLRDLVNQNKLHFVGSDHIKTIRDQQGASDTTFLFYRRRDTSIPTNGILSVPISTTNEGMPYGTGSVGSIGKRTIFVYVDETVSIDFDSGGTVSGMSGENTLTGVSTSFTRLNVGDRVRINSVNYVVASIDSDTELEIVGTFASTFSGESYTKHYIKGDLIDLNSKGSAAGVIRTVDATSSSLTIDLKESFPTSTDSVVVHQAFRSEAEEIKKLLRPNRYVKINCSTLPDLDQIFLGFSDVYRIREIRKDTSEITSDTQGSDVTADFILNTGQTESAYETAFLIPKTPLTSSDHLLVRFDYFEPDFTVGKGYFSIDSYPINDSPPAQGDDTSILTVDIPRFVSSAGNEFNLRNYIDTRPVFEATANTATIISESSTNPAKSTAIQISPNGLRNPIPGSNITFDYSFYLARRDVVAVDSKGEFTVIQGVPAINPVHPVVPNTHMGIANLFIPPYPTLSSTTARIRNQVAEGVQAYQITHARQTMRDLNVLKQRVKNLEYYNALNLLEKSALDLTVLDANGLDRFKNGVFVDGFVDHSLGDTTDPDYHIAIDKKENTIRPVFDVDAFNCQFSANTGNGTQVGNLITVPFQEFTLINQPNVTTSRNIEQSVFRFIGNLEVFPQVDTWVDTTTIDRTIEFGNKIAPEDLIRTEWGSWETYTTGVTSGTNKFNVYSRTWNETSGDLSKASLVATFDTYAEAAAFSKTIRYGYIETAGFERTETDTNVRTGITSMIGVEDELNDLGSFVTNASLIPYIRPQAIRLYARGLKANTRVYVYFDGESMSRFCVPVEIPESGDLTSLDGVGIKGQPLRTDEFGEFLCYLILPEAEKQFRVGTKEIVITDSPTNSVDATTYAKNSFSALGLNIQSQNTILSTQNVTGIETELLNESFSTTRITSQKQKVDIFGSSCMAYSFFVDLPEDVPGVYLTSVDVFIKEMHPTLGVWFEIREMDNAGGITRKQVPFSEVWMKRDDPRIKLSSDASQSTKVDFECPVFLYNDRQYALVIHTEGLNPDTYFWVSRLGQTDIKTGRPVTGRQLTGTTFTTNNNLNWDIVPDVDLTVRFNVANFNINETIECVFENEDYEFIEEAELMPIDVGEPFEPFEPGEPVEGSDVLTIVNLPSLSAGSKVKGFDLLGNPVVGEVVSVSGNKVKTKGFDFAVGSAVTFETNIGNPIPSTNASVTGKENGFAKIRKIEKDNREKLDLEESNGLFFEGAEVRTKYKNKNSKFEIIEFGGYTFTALNVRPGYVVLPSTGNVRFKMRTRKENTQQDQEVTIQPYDNIEFNDVKKILTKSKEVELLGGQKSFRVTCELETKNKFVAPVVDNDLMNAVFVMNNLNDDTTDEDLPLGGALDSKYISRVVTLAEGQDAEDLLVFLREYVPPGTELKVYARLRNKYDIEQIREKEWIELEEQRPRFSSLANKNDFIEVRYSLPTELMTGTFGEIQYESDGNTFTGFKQFQIKVGMVGGNPAVYPKAAQLMALALQI
jgi:hypothetical protein